MWLELDRRVREEMGLLAGVVASMHAFKSESSLFQYYSVLTLFKAKSRRGLGSTGLTTYIGQT